MVCGRTQLTHSYMHAQTVFYADYDDGNLGDRLVELRRGTNKEADI